MTSGCLLRFALGGLGLFLNLPAHAQCAPEWLETFDAKTTPAFNPALEMLVVDEDGPGPEAEVLYVSGWEEDKLGPALWRWDGSEWALIGQTTGWVYGAAWHDADGPGPDPGALYLAGGFTAINGVPLNKVARWTGSDWEQVGSIAHIGTIYDIVSYDVDGAGPSLPLLVVAGTPGGTSPPYKAIQEWDGRTWRGFAGGEGYNLAIPDLELYSPGNGFTYLFTAVYFGVVYWDIDHWVIVDANDLGWTIDTRAMAVVDHDGDGPEVPWLYFGGPHSPFPSRLARCSLTSAEMVSTQITGFLITISAHDEDGVGPMPSSLFIAGEVSAVNGVPANRVARWDGRQWSALDAGISSGAVISLASGDHDGDGPQPPSLFAGGFAFPADGMFAHNVAEWGCQGPVTCGADVDDDGTVGIDDVFGVIGAWGSSNTQFDIAPSGAPNGVVDIEDLFAIIAAWGPCE
jgi:hypothetical protein